MLSSLLCLLELDSQSILALFHESFRIQMVEKIVNIFFYFASTDGVVTWTSVVITCELKIHGKRMSCCENGKLVNITNCPMGKREKELKINWYYF